GNSARPGLAYAVQAVPSNDIESFTLQIGGAALRRFGQRQEFLWAGDNAAGALSGEAQAGPPPPAGIHSGARAPFHFLSAADRVSSGGTVYEYDIRGSTSIGRQSVTNTPVAVLKLQVEANGAPGLFASLPAGCVGRVAQ